MEQCRSCLAKVTEDSQFCPRCGVVLAVPPGGTKRVFVSTEAGGPTTLPLDRKASRSTSDTSLHGRFLPGTLLDDRYRIVALLGQGGMGEVYRADDLKLGYQVALKFLPSHLAQDPHRLSLLHNEVRLARQVSHPNVCRVYDIGEVDGQPFLTMEYIDGEDLRGLLRRIGRLPKTKGVQIARQLCAGLAAAHDKSVVHRDLKPANVMIDGQGQARITDFGLACAAEAGEEDRRRMGTPAYMAPEQLARNETSVQSDLYALGLVLYELFTGQRAYQAPTLAELVELREESPLPAKPSSVVEDMDAAVERAILRCLEKDPRERPRSALAVAAALPGGDPLAEAVAAGETPSPQMVAAAGEGVRISPVAAVACLAGAVAGLVLLCFLEQHVSGFNRVPMEVAPPVLAAKAQQILGHLGYTNPPIDTAFGFGWRMEDALKSHERAKGASGAAPGDYLRTALFPGLDFWYRQSPGPLVMNGFFDSTGTDLSLARVAYDQPPLNQPGMAGVRLNTSGKLRYFKVVPPAVREPGSVSGQPDWAGWFPAEFVGFELDRLKRTPARRTPPHASDAVQSWEGTWPGSGEKLYVAAAAYQGKPVWFQLFRPWEIEGNGQTEKATPSVWMKRAEYMFTVLDYLMLLGAAVLARRNVRLQRADRRGAFRASMALFVFTMVTWLLKASHVAGIAESALFYLGLSQALLEAGRFWLFYLALEPAVRRSWPHVLIGWTRLLDARIRDPWVGRDFLLGSLAGIVWLLIFEMRMLVPAWLGLETPSLAPLVWLEVNALLGPAMLGATLLRIFTTTAFFGVFYLLMMLLARVLLRRAWLAGSVGVAVVALSYAMLWGGPEIVLPPMLLVVALNYWLLCRFGLLAFMVSFFVGNFLVMSPLTTHLSVWYAGNGLFGMGLVLIIAYFGFRTALGGHPILHDKLLEETRPRPL